MLRVWVLNNTCMNTYSVFSTNSVHLNCIKTISALKLLAESDHSVFYLDAVFDGYSILILFKMHILQIGEGHEYTGS